MPTSRALTCSIDERGIAWVILDVVGEAQNTLNPRFSGELEDVLSRLEKDGSIKAAVLASGKPDSFLAGADVTMLKGLRNAKEAEELSRSGQRVFDRLEGLPIPVVAAIQGACLGGGLELALACRARVAAEDPKTVLGVPEVQLGLICGAGGTQRLPRLIGIGRALELLLTGKHVKPRKAQSIGLVDETCPPSILREVAARKALSLAAGAGPGTRARRRLRPSARSKLAEMALEDNPLGRTILFKKAKKNVLKKTRGHYPAPLRTLEAVRVGIEKGAQAGYAAEARLFGESVVDPVAKNLIGLFFAQTALKKDSGVDDLNVVPLPVKKVGVLGGGLMGGGIAYASAAVAKIPVRIKEVDDAGVARGLLHVQGLLDQRVKRRSITPLEAQDMMALVSGTTDFSGFHGVDLVIEAVFEDLELKHRLLKDVEAVATAGCVYASNTSTIPISKIAEASSRPEMACGMHFFSPVHKMPLLEVIVTPQTAPWVTATAVALGKKLGKTVIVVNDGPGFYTSRILGPYMNEATFLLAEGVPIEVIDKALMAWGFPVGPLTLLDEVGIDVAFKAGKVMQSAFAARMTTPPVIARLAEDGRAGRKNQKGFYLYGGKEKRPDESVYGVVGVVPTKRPPPAEDIAERVALQMINEAARCLGEGILRSPRDGDIGAIFGLGFPPFRGGPFRWLDSEGIREVVARLDRLAQAHGPRYEAAPILRDYARSGKEFYPT
ncbi:MAG: fatty acid oxidation complex subunit alpha FadJ [Deltaproteobacteria bacterium]|nr:fatty acid oxidation complex subunit alpha FadJ [Deltaproteobacteria bacterium]